ncbi:LysR family transcriptional regulator [Roseobacter sinensis]|uniref:LysR family transcriptional regulator n=1 Tax=Roseobacter sinensis TaxID=2931391 RepID=A0ABT3BLU2_9RHOB|nr:LysR family transcriptional regulator [Roseobacter sp. WL0113]MCV3274268.1 LysR family transcriptional regulator [Roseobacter sp. WL0113]
MTEFSKQLSKIEIQDLLTLLLVGQLGSFRQAAENLDVRQSTISRRVGKLEDALGVSLFDRRSTGVQLTNAGLIIFEQFNEIRTNFDAAVLTAQHAGISDTGALRVAIAVSIAGGAARQVVKRFREEHPAVNLDFVEADCPTALKMLNHREVDVAMICGDQPTGNYDTLPVKRDRVLVAVPCTSSLAKRNELRWGNIRKEDFIVSVSSPLLLGH